MLGRASVVSSPDLHANDYRCKCEQSVYSDKSLRHVASGSEDETRACVQGSFGARNVHIWGR